MYFVCYEIADKAHVELTADPLNTHSSRVTPDMLEKVNVKGMWEHNGTLIVKEGVWDKNGS